MIRFADRQPSDMLCDMDTTATVVRSFGRNSSTLPRPTTIPRGNDDSLYDLKEVCEIIADGMASRRRIPLVTVNRWIRKGCRGVILRSQLVGSRRYVRASAIREFLEALNESPASAA